MIIVIQVPFDQFLSGAPFLRIAQNPALLLLRDGYETIFFFLYIKNRGRRVQVAPRGSANVLSEDAAPLEAHL